VAAAHELNLFYARQKKTFLQGMADELDKRRAAIKEANRADIEEGRIFLDFTIRVDARVARDYIHVEPAVRHEVEPWNEGLCLRGKFEPGILYRVRLRGGLPAEGGRFLPDDVVRSVRMPELAESISFLGEGRFLNRQGSLNVMVRTVNVDPIEVRIERIFTGITRRTMPTVPRCWKMLQRKRPSPGTE
jgi:hypothetical protein